MIKPNKLGRERHKHVTRSDRLAELTNKCIAHIRSLNDALKSMGEALVSQQAQMMAIINILHEKGILIPKTGESNDNEKVQITEQNADSTNLETCDSGPKKSGDVTEIHLGNSESQSELSTIEGERIVAVGDTIDNKT